MMAWRQLAMTLIMTRRLDARLLWGLQAGVARDVSGCWWGQGLIGASRIRVETLPSIVPPRSLSRQSFDLCDRLDCGNKSRVPSSDLSVVFGSRGCV